MPLLEAKGVSVRFGGVVALDGVSFAIEPRQVVGLIGPNGAGKTTLFNCVSRLCAPCGGEITFDGQSILALPAHRMAGLGLGRTFQNLALFPSLTVRQNVLTGAHCRTRSGFLGSALGLARVAREEAAVAREADEVLDFLGLSALAGRPALGLPFATLKRVELARALASRPKLLLLDEPAGGLNHEEVAALGALIRRIRDTRALTVLLVEHHMGLVMDVSERVVVLDFGRKIAEGTPAEIRRHPEVIRAYLGQGAETPCAEAAPVPREEATPVSRGKAA